MPAPTAVPWNDVIRSGLTVPVPLAIGIALDSPTLGLFGSLGALLGVLAERSGTSGQRLARISGALAVGTVAMVLGRYTYGIGVVPLLVVLGFALVSGVLCAVHPLLSFAGMQLLVQMSIAGGLHTDVALGQVVLVYVGGGVWAIAGAWVQSSLEHTDMRYRAGVVDIVRRSAQILREAGEGSPSGAAPPGAMVTRRRAEASLEAAYDLVLAARPRSARRRREVNAVIALLSEMPALVASVVALATSRDHRRAAGELAGSLDGLAEAIARHDHDWCVSVADPGAGDAETALRTAVLDSVAAVARAIRVGETGPEFARPALRVHDPVAVVLRRPTTWSFTLRLMLCMGVAEILRQIDPLGHGYWILLTAALTLKPDFQPVLPRVLQRGLGTVVGGVLGVAVLMVPVGYAVLPVIAVLSAGIPYTVRRNYGMFSTLVTPIVLLLLDFGGPAGLGIVVQRLVNTVLGCAVVLVLGYLAWPGTWRPQTPARLAACADGLARFLRLGFREPQDAAQIEAARRTMYQLVEQLRTSLRFSQFEPGPIGRSVAGWSQLIGDMEDAADTATRLVVLRRYPAPGSTLVVEPAAAEFEELARRLRDDAQPDDFRHPPVRLDRSSPDE
ncbi:FUSC family protein [Pseudonocardia xinjiangensis]|uniref:FUSC family protein n=1 Tax=Pseudonocardia xinjiangensis TaxID=75289 RepID=UPI003D8FF7A9